MTKPKQTEIEMEGAGVAPVKDRELTKACGSFGELLVEQERIKNELDDLELLILERMAALGIGIYRCGDILVSIKVGKSRVKIKSVTVKEGDEKEES